MRQINLPALDGRSPLGVLAALGLLRLLDRYTDDSPRLSWDQNTLTAVLHSSRGGTDEVVNDLIGVMEGIEAGSVLPGVPAGFPPPREAPARLKFPQEELGGWVEGQLGPMPPANAAEASLWISSLVSDLSHTRDGNAVLSQYVAISGQQTVTTMLSKSLQLVRGEPDLLRQALTGWRRVPGVTGEYLDHRAMWDATEAPDGATGMMRGVPGATWLALMSYPMFRTTGGPSNRPASSGWHTVTEGRRRYSELRLPIWVQSVGVSGVIALIEHPGLAPRKPRRSNGVVVDDGLGYSPQLSPLGVVGICRARRHQPAGGKSAGVLTPTR